MIEWYSAETIASIEHKVTAFGSFTIYRWEIEKFLNMKPLSSASIMDIIIHAGVGNAILKSIYEDLKPLLEKRGMKVTLTKIGIDIEKEETDG